MVYQIKLSNPMKVRNSKNVLFWFLCIISRDHNHAQLYLRNGVTIIYSFPRLFIQLFELTLDRGSLWEITHKVTFLLQFLCKLDNCHGYNLRFLCNIRRHYWSRALNLILTTGLNSNQDCSLTISSLFRFRRQIAVTPYNIMNTDIHILN